MVSITKAQARAGIILTFLIIAIFAFISISSRAIEVNGWRLETVDCDTSQPVNEFHGLQKLNICYKVTNLQNSVRSFEQFLKLYPNVTDSSDLTNFALWKNVTYDAVVYDYGNVSYNRTYYDVIDQIDSTHYNIKETASNSTTEKYCEAASLSNEWCYWNQWEVTGNHTEQKWKLNWNYYQSTQFTKISADYFKISQLQIPANGDMLFKASVDRKNSNSQPFNWKFDLTITDGSLNAILDPNLSGNYTYKCPIYLNEGIGQGRTGQPVVVNISTATGCFNGHLTNSKEIAITNDAGIEVTRMILETDNSTWALVAFNVTNATPNTNNFTYFVYYGDPTAAPAYQKETTWFQYLGMNVMPNVTQPFGASEPWDCSAAPGEMYIEDGTLHINDTSFINTPVKCTYLWSITGNTNFTIQTKVFIPWTADSGYWVTSWYDSAKREFIVATNATPPQIRQFSAPTNYFEIDYRNWLYYRIARNSSEGWELYMNETRDIYTLRLNGTQTQTTPHNALIFESAGDVAKSEAIIDYFWFHVGGSWKDNLNPSVGAEIPIIINTPPNISQPNIIPSVARANDTLSCSATPTDKEQTSLTVSFIWYKNGARNDSFNASVPAINNTPTSTNVPVTGQKKGDSWVCSARAFDGELFSAFNNSTSVTILNSAPTHLAPKLISTSGKNFSTDDLICQNQNTSDVDADNVTNIFNFLVNGTSMAVLNLPFETSARDYSGFGNNGTLVGGAAITNDSQVGQAVSLNGVNGYVEVPNTNSIQNITEAITLEAWFKINSTNKPNQAIMSKNVVNAHRIVVNNTGTVYYVEGTTGGTVVLNSTANAISPNTWYHVVGVYDGSQLKLYLNGQLVASKPQTGNLLTNTNPFQIGRCVGGLCGADEYFNGTIDEVKVYNRALSAEQILANFNLKYNTTVSAQTRGGEVYKCEVTPNDREVDGLTKSSGDLTVLWAVTFNVTSSAQDQLPVQGAAITCNQSASFNQGGDLTNPYGPYGFPPGIWQCSFAADRHFNTTANFTADNDKTVNVLMPESGGLTFQEHEWLEAIYKCIALGDCTDLSILTQINNTVTNIWREVRPSDKSVVLNETIVSNVLGNTSNITVNYTIFVPSKAGYDPGDLLPIRVSFWFLNNTTGTPICYNQGILPPNVSVNPFCSPLIAQTLGPMEGTVKFTVNLKPNLPLGTYSFVSRVDIDPRGLWVNYGQKQLGTVSVLETIADPFIDITKTAEFPPEKKSGSSPISSSGGGGGSSSEEKAKTTTPEIQNPQVINPITSQQQVQTGDQDKPSPISGLVTLTKATLSGKEIIIIVAILSATLIVIVLLQTIGKIKVAKHDSRSTNSISLFKKKPYFLL